MKTVLTEFIGAFFLVFTIGLTAAQAVPFAPLAIGLTLMVMVYMGGHISGAHYNPAVSFALALRKKLDWSQYLPYVIAQIAGAIGAALMVQMITGSTFAPMPAAGAPVLSALLVEILFTFALALVVLNVATHPKTAGNSYYGLAIGFTIAAAAFAGGGISGGAYNPAVGIGPTLVHALFGGGSFAALWLYIIGPLAGATLAAAVYAVQEK